jgi:hypothetical protein
MVGRRDTGSTNFSTLEELDGIEGLLDIWHFVLEADESSLGVHLHELVFPAYAASSAWL